LSRNGQIKPKFCPAAIQKNKMLPANGIAIHGKHRRRKTLSAASKFISETLNVARQYGDWFTPGEVKKIDESAGKITIKHGPIKKFDMEDGMTMVYRVQDPAMLKAVKPGDKVSFEADQINGQFTVMKIQKER